MDVMPVPHATPTVVPMTERAAQPILTVTATFTLSEPGRKASLLTGGDGRAHQRLRVDVPAARIHLVGVDANGAARLKLQPRYEETADAGVLRHDSAPTYDHPPTVEELFREAARNYELERVWRTEQTTRRSQRRDADRERRQTAAADFLADPAQRALVHPIPTATRCFLASADGRLMFDVATDVALAAQVSREAHQRFRADLQARRDRNLALHAEQVALHEQKCGVVQAWVAERGTDDQRARHAAGVLAMNEVI